MRIAHLLLSTLLLPEYSFVVVECHPRGGRAGVVHSASRTGLRHQPANSDPSDNSDVIHVEEVYPCVSFESVMDKVDNSLTDDQCETNSCSNGCCRNYNFLVCDETNGMPFLACVCNENTARRSQEVAFEQMGGGSIATDNYYISSMTTTTTTTTTTLTTNFLENKSNNNDLPLSRGLNYPQTGTNSATLRRQSKGSYNHNNNMHKLSRSL